MLELLNIRIHFFCRKSFSSSDGKHPIIMRIIYRSERRDLFTGIYCEKNQWNSKSGCLLLTDKKATTINKNLELIQRKSYEAFEQLKFGVTSFTIDELINKIKGKEERPTLLMDYLETEKKDLGKRLRVDITPATYDKYRRSASHVQHFLETEFKVKNFPLHRIDGRFLEKYFQYLRNTRGISHNTSVKYVVFFKTILMPAIRSGVFKNDPFKDIRFRLKPVYKEYLSKEEIDQLSELVFESKDLERIRDIFLFACYTGLAYSDIKQLGRHNILKDMDDSYYIRKPRQKTGQECIIPVLPAAKRILEKYSLTSDFRDFQWYVSSNQKMNQRLKTIGKLAGLTKDLHCHLARHSFATTITLSNGVPIETVSKMLGHSSLKQTQHYAKIVSQKVKFDMAKISALFK